MSLISLFILFSSLSFKTVTNQLTGVLPLYLDRYCSRQKEPPPVFCNVWWGVVILSKQWQQVSMSSSWWHPLASQLLWLRGHCLGCLRARTAAQAFIHQGLGLMQQWGILHPSVSSRSGVLDSSHTQEYWPHSLDSGQKVYSPLGPSGQYEHGLTALLANAIIPITILIGSADVCFTPGAALTTQLQMFPLLQRTTIGCRYSHC
jgi:hypothetical protein